MTTVSITYNGLPGFSIVDDSTVSKSFSIFTAVWERVVDVVVTFNGLTHTFPDDLDFLLVGSRGTNLEFWSDVGGNTAITNVNFTIADFGFTPLPDDTGLVSNGVAHPTDFGAVESAANWGLPSSMVINHPVPHGTAGFASAFGGVWANGETWSLYVRDDSVLNVGSLASWSLTVRYDVIVKPDDFNANFVSDILWQSSDGTPGIWLMDGSNALSIGAVGPFNPGASWHIRDDGDFDGDGHSDVLWQSEDGTPAIWFMSGTNVVSFGVAGSFNPGATWQIKATGDFNFDTKADILWQSGDGTPGIWLMDGFNALSIGAVGPFNPGPSWQIKGTGDFNNDGNSDILWQNSDGTPAIWLMNGFNVVAMGAVGPFNPGPGWQVMGTGDYNFDNKSDILWQSTDGTPAIWFMDGMNFISGSAAGSFNPGHDWHVIA
jgi:hypothetical protein